MFLASLFLSFVPILAFFISSFICGLIWALLRMGLWRAAPDD